MLRANAIFVNGIREKSNYNSIFIGNVMFKVRRIETGEVFDVYATSYTEGKYIPNEIHGGHCESNKTLFLIFDSKVAIDWVWRHASAYEPVL